MDVLTNYTAQRCKKVTDWRTVKYVDWSMHTSYLPSARRRQRVVDITNLTRHQFRLLVILVLFGDSWFFGLVSSILQFGHFNVDTHFPACQASIFVCLGAYFLTKVRVGNQHPSPPWTPLTVHGTCLLIHDSYEGGEFPSDGLEDPCVS